MHKISRQVALYADIHLALAMAKLSASYFYQSIPLCVVDAVFSVGVRYRQVEKVVEYLCKQQGWEQFRGYSPYPPPAAQAKIADLVNLFTGLVVLSQHDAKRIFNNQGYINPSAKKKNPTLKAEVIRQFAKILMNNKIETFQDWNLLTAVQKENIGIIVNEVPGLKSGVIMRYFAMLAGDDNQVKPDRMILRFLKKAVSEDGVSVSDAVMIIRDACALLKPKYPDLTPRLLDHMIWKYQRQNENS